MEVDELQRALKPSQEQAINLAPPKNITTQGSAGPKVIVVIDDSVKE